MSDPIYDLIDIKQEGGCGVSNSRAMRDSVEAHLARWQAANAQPRVYFEHIDAHTWKVSYGDDVDFYPFAAWAVQDIERQAAG